MPTIMRVGPYRFFFFSNEGNEPAHVHVERDDAVAKFWLNPVALEYNDGFSKSELGKIEKIVIEHRKACLESWNEHFKR